MRPRVPSTEYPFLRLLAIALEEQSMGRVRSRSVGPMALGFALAISGCGSEAPKPSAPVGGSGRFVEEREGQPFRHLVVEGTPYEMGFHVGEAMKELGYSSRGVSVERAALDVYTREFRKLLPGDYAEELRGIAAGVGEAADDLLSREVAREVKRWTGTKAAPLYAALACAPGSSPSAAIAFQNHLHTVHAPYPESSTHRDDSTVDVSVTPGGVEWGGQYSTPRPVLVERHPTGGVATILVAYPGSLGGLAGISSRGVVIASCEDDSLPSERRSLRGLPFAAGVRHALETGTDAQTAFDALPRLVGNRVLIADATNRRIDALVGLSVVGYTNTDPNAWVLRPAGEGEERERNEAAQQERLGRYPARPGAADAMDLAVAGRNAASTFPVLLLKPDGIEVRDAAGKTWTYGWTR